MPRSKFLLVLALLLLLSIPATAVLSDGHGLGEGYATVFDDAGMSDGLEVSLMGAEAPDEGKEYAVWLANEDQSAVLRVGTLDVGEDGSASLTFNSSSSGYAGADLIATYTSLAISVEDAGSSPSSPSGQGEASDIFEGSMLEQVRGLMMAMSELRTQLKAASMNAGMAAESESLEDVMSYVEMTAESLDGAIEHAAAASAAAAAVGATGEEGSGRSVHAALAQTTAENAKMYAMMARDAAQSALDQDDVSLAKIFVGPGGSSVVSLSDAALSGFDANGNTTLEGNEGGAMQAYRHAQQAVAWSPKAGGLPVLATPTPLPTATPVPPPQPTAPGLPGVGGDTVSPVVLMAIAAAAGLLVIGGAMSIRNRTRRVRSRS